MKRVVKFWNQFQSDNGKYSDVGTHIEILPILVDDNAGIKELNAIVKKLGLKTKGGVKKGVKPQRSWYKNRLTHYINLNEFTEPKFSGKEVFQWNLGFIQLPDKEWPLKAVESIKTKMTEEQAYSVRDATAYGVRDNGELLNPNPKGKNEDILIMEDWTYYNDMELLGYDRDHFEKLLGITDRYFEDSVEQCSKCMVYDSKDNGYEMHHTYVDGEGTFGHRCGCYDEYCKDHIEEFANDPKKYFKRELSLELIEEGKLKHLETFIGGMVDGRGGWFAGKATRENTPEAALAEYQKKFPKDDFVLIFEESGQFQTYFSICKINKRKSKAS